ncbi:MAG: DUF4845 domain-containing protein [Alloalcanivorax sp.]
MSMISWAVVLIVAAILGTAAFRMIPAYMEHNTISTTIRSQLQDGKTALMSPREIRAGIGKRFTINQVNVIRVDDLAIVKEGGVLTVSTDYEVREPMFYNVSIVMTFKDEFKKDVRQ